MAHSKPQMDLPQMKQVTCPLCSEVYKSPKTLPCLHSFCEKCIHDFIISIGKTKGKDNKLTSFNCPVCRTVVRPNDSSLELEKWAESLHQNIVAELIIAKAEGKTLDCILCKRLDRTTEAKYWCSQCEGVMCDKCQEIHSVIGVSSDHSVTLIKDMIEDTKGIDFGCLQGKRCKNHLERYCFIHKKLCCSRCFKLDHIECDTCSIDDKIDIDELLSTLPGDLASLQVTIGKLVKVKEENKSRLSEYVREVQDEAYQRVESTKNKLDELYETFKKNLNVFHEEENTKMNVRLRLLEQFTKTLHHWITVTSKLKGKTTETQVIVLLETIKSQIDVSVKEIKSSLKEDCTINLTFEKNHVLSEEKDCIFGQAYEQCEIEAVENIGSFAVTRREEVCQMQPIYKDCKRLGLFCPPSYEDTIVEYIKHICFQNDSLRCGVSMDQQHAIVGNLSDGRELQIVDLSSGNVLTTTRIREAPKRVCFDKNSNKVFVACWYSQLYTTTVSDNKFSDPIKIPYRIGYVGGMCTIEDNVYVLVAGAVKTVPKDADLTEKDAIKDLFETNTGPDNGLGTYDGNLIYTTYNEEVKSSTTNGETLFCYKNPNIENPIALAILPSGSILVLDSYDGGKLHLISADGQRHRTLLEKFDNVKEPKDVWLGEDKSTIYVCGGEYIDVYRML